ncbi:hypothetical protein BGZ83_007520 [Gryganskiella cystojenkinii]|nr:hypothetical protein BGZ83_007520 [Gryganskiella cystojenkinii]
MYPNRKERLKKSRSSWSTVDQQHLEGHIERFKASNPDDWAMRDMLLSVMFDPSWTRNRNATEARMRRTLGEEALLADGAKRLWGLGPAQGAIPSIKAEFYR